ncbi:MAG TPA: hypothetical protein VM142_04965 [Acidimicrobiales bacterium]|nr:hypothetical protein [Acidimicrobiales bacterium]
MGEMVTLATAAAFVVEERGEVDHPGGDAAAEKLENDVVGAVVVDPVGRAVEHQDLGAGRREHLLVGGLDLPSIAEELDGGVAGGGHPHRSVMESWLPT